MPLYSHKIEMSVENCAQMACNLRRKLNKNNNKAFFLKQLNTKVFLYLLSLQCETKLG